MEVKMGDLGNKSNPWLAGLTGLGEGLLQGYLYKQKMNQQQDEFNQKMAAEERQNSLLNDIAMKKYQSELQNQTMDNQRQDVNTIINLNANYDVKKASDYPDGKYPTGAITGSSLLGSLSNKGLVSPDAVYVPKVSDGGMTANQKLERGLEARRLAVEERRVALLEKGKGQELTPYQQEMQDRYNQKVEDNRSQKQQLYNDIMATEWDANKSAYVITDKSGNETQFKTDAALERYARGEVIKSKIPGKINMWTRSKQSRNSSNSKQSGNSNQSGQYVEGKIYIDANGNKAKYVNGKWEEIQ